MRKGLFSKGIVVFCIVFITAYTIVSTYIFTRYNIEATTLTTCVFAFYGGELMLCCLKRVFSNSEKSKKEESSEDVTPPSF